MKKLTLILFLLFVSYVTNTQEIKFYQKSNDSIKTVINLDIINSFHKSENYKYFNDSIKNYDSTTINILNNKYKKWKVIELSNDTLIIYDYPNYFLYYLNMFNINYKYKNQ